MIAIDTGCNKHKIKKILLSDNCWYNLADDMVLIKDAFEIGEYNEQKQSWILNTDMGIGIECVLENGDILMTKLSEIKAWRVSKW